MRKVALYCRVSSDEQKERDTIENQVEILNTYIELKDGLNVYKEYLDNGITGTIAFEQRPAGKSLIEDASKGLFDTVLVWKVDRFGRDTLTGLSTVEILRKYDIEIISVTEPFDLNTPTGRFQFITYLNMAELERNNILDRMFLGATRAAKKGKWLGGIVPYGYVKNNGFLEIEPKEAEVIKTIFKLYIDEGLSTLNIAVYLNNLNVPSSCSIGKCNRSDSITGKWRSGSVLRIISNTTYKGVHYYGKRGTRRKELIKREVPQIVSEEIWEKAQKVKESNIIMSKRNMKNREFLLRKLIKCEHCKKTFYGITYKDRSSVYSCAGKKSVNTKVLGYKCSNLNINADLIEETVWNKCLHILKNYDYYINQINLKSDNEDDNLLEDLNKFKKNLSDKNLEKNNILSLFRKGIINETELDEQLKDIRKEEENIGKLISSFENKIESYSHKDMLINEMSRKLKIYHDKLDNLSIEDKYEIVKLFVKSITAETIVENGERASKFHIVYNLVKLDNHTDMGSLLLQA